MSRPAPWGSAVAAHARMELALTARRGENLLAMVGIPLAVLLLAAGAPRDPSSSTAAAGDPAGVLALAIVASGMVNLGIATAYERGYGVLKRLGGSPLGRSGLVAAKVGIVTAIAIVQVAVLLAAAWIVLGWRPGPGASIAVLVLVTLVGAGTFAGIGLLIAGTRRPEAALVIANVLFLAAIPLGGGLGSVIALPQPLPTVAAVLPVGALADGFRAALGTGTGPTVPLAILGAWGVAATVAAARRFRWE